MIASLLRFQILRVAPTPEAAEASTAQRREDPGRVSTTAAAMLAAAAGSAGTTPAGAEASAGTADRGPI